MRVLELVIPIHKLATIVTPVNINLQTLQQRMLVPIAEPANTKVVVVVVPVRIAAPDNSKVIVVVLPVCLARWALTVQHTVDVSCTHAHSVNLFWGNTRNLVTPTKHQRHFQVQLQYQKIFCVLLCHPYYHPYIILNILNIL